MPLVEAFNTHLGVEYFPPCCFNEFIKKGHLLPNVVNHSFVGWCAFELALLRNHDQEHMGYRV